MQDPCYTWKKKAQPWICNQAVPWRKEILSCSSLCITFNILHSWNLQEHVIKTNFSGPILNCQSCRNMGFGHTHGVYPLLKEMWEWYQHIVIHLMRLMQVILTEDSAFGGFLTIFLAFLHSGFWKECLIKRLLKVELVYSH